MEIFCTERFKSEFAKLSKKNSYKSLESAIIEHFFNCSDEKVNEGSRITGSSTQKVIKKRLGVSGGYRAYFYAYIVEKRVFLMYVYPKLGSERKKSLNGKFETEIINETSEAIERQNLYKITSEEGKLHFNRQKSELR